MKKYIAVLLAVIMVLSANLTVFALTYESNEPKLVTMEEYYDSDGAKHEKYVDENGNEVYPEFETNSVHTNVTLPSSYDARTTDRVTSVKNQNPFGTCWAHAFCASAEASLITQGYETKDTINLSEAHLAWFSFNSAVSGSTLPIEGDNYAASDPFDNGGNSFLAAATVARWSGLSTEEKYPYSTTASKMQFKAKEKYVSDYQLDSMISYPATDRTAVKEAIMKNGSLATSYYSDSNNYINSSDGYCYYQNVQTGTNHAVTAVGWDDNFPASNFKNTPAGNGAWLIKNSWGPTWGYSSGYFWLSYYDTSVNHFDEVNVKPAGDYQHNYQYDGTVTYAYRYYTGKNSVYYANIFTADGTQTVDASYFKVEDGCTATVYLYTDLTSSTKPTSGTLRSKATVECPAKGYYTAKFSEHYKVTSGQKFAIVINVETDSVDAKIPIEQATGSITYTASAGQSFYGYTITSWNDAANYKGNIPIKVLTNDYKDVKVTSINLTHLPNKTSYLIGDELDTTGLIVTANYDDGSKKILNSSEYTLQGFDSNTNGQKTITISYNGFTATFTVDVTCVDHNYSDTVTSPTWESAGLTVHRCTICGYEYSETTHMSGTNNGITWTFDETTGALTIDGTGNMSDYSDSKNPFMNNQYINTVNIGAGVTRLPVKMFVGQTNLEAVNVSPDGGFTLADNTLYNSDKTELVYCFAKDSESYTVPVTVRTVDGYAFAEYSNLKDVYFNDKGEVWGSVVIGDGNDLLLNATMHFRYDGIETILSNKGSLMFGFNEGTKPDEIGNYITSTDAEITATPVRGTAIGTGATIKTTYSDGREEENTALIFGDVNSDGWYDGMDSIVANCLANGMLTREQVGDVVYMAADCNCDGIVNRTDIYILENAGLSYLDVAQNGRKNTEINIPYTGDVSYDEETFFISDIYVATSNVSLSAARIAISFNGYTPISYDLNRGADGAYVCMGYKTTDNYDEAIKDVRFYAGAKDTDNSTVELKFGNEKCTYFMSNKTDLNYRASGDYVYAYYTKDSAAGPAITAISFGTPEELIGRRIASLLDNQNVSADLNSNTPKHTTIYCALTDVGV